MHTTTLSIVPADEWATRDMHRWDCTCGIAGVHLEAGHAANDSRDHARGVGAWKRRKTA